MSLLDGICETCDGNTVKDNDADDDGVCDDDEKPGCTNAAACNYDSEATDEDNSCTLPGACEVCVYIYIYTHGDQ